MTPLLALVLVGCPKTRPEPAVDPAASFRLGVDLATRPDRRGELDLAAAYLRFDEAASMGGGPRASFNAGLAAELLGRPDDAERQFRAAIAADPEYDAATLALAGVLEARGDHDGAVALFRDRAARLPGARGDLVGALARAGRHDEAVAAARDALRADPADAAVYRQLAAAFQNRGDDAMALLLAEKALHLGGGDPDVYNDLGVADWARGDRSAAVERFRAAIALASDHFGANTNLGFVALASGDFEAAKQLFEVAHAADPTSLDATLGLAVALRGTGDPRGAGVLYDRIIAADPLYDAAYLDAATLHERTTGDLDAAMRYLRALVEAHDGELPASHPVFDRIVQLEEAMAEKARARRLADDEERAARARREANAALLSSLGSATTAASACPDPAVVEAMDQAEQVIAAGDAELAADAHALLAAALAEACP